MMRLETIGTESMPSVLSDPFKKAKVTSIDVSYSKKLFKDGFEARGSVKFENGDTTGRQDFRGETFDEVVLQIKRFLETLE